MSTPHPLILGGWIVADLTATLGVIASVLLLAGVIGLGVAVFVWARKWRQRLGEEPTIEAQIESYRHMLNDGVIDDDEFDRIVAQLQGRPASPSTGIAPGLPPRPADRHSTDLRPGPAPPGPPPEPPSESAP